jgi:hypothetical protein
MQRCAALQTAYISSACDRFSQSGTADADRAKCIGSTSELSKQCRDSCREFEANVPCLVSQEPKDSQEKDGSVHAAHPGKCLARLPTVPRTVASVASFTEKGGPIAVSPALSIATADSNLVSATVAITGGGFAGDTDLFGTTIAGINITASYNYVQDVLTLTGSDTVSHYIQVLQAVTFTAGENPANYGLNPTRTVTWAINDGQPFHNIGIANTTVTITNVNGSRQLSGVAATAAFTAAGPVTLSPTLNLSDPDSLNLASATVAVTAGAFTGDRDVRGGPGCLNRFSASISGASARVRLPSGVAAG